jgi:hypothetical protein
MNNSQSVRELSQALADELYCCGHEISSLDILDALASTGLSLTRDRSGAASTAYFTELMPEGDDVPR